MPSLCLKGTPVGLSSYTYMETALHQSSGQHKHNLPSTDYNCDRPLKLNLASAIPGFDCRVKHLAQETSHGACVEPS
eukprot:155396-Chlamydomonas_euryale.AAC.1